MYVYVYEFLILLFLMNLINLVCALINIQWACEIIAVYVCDLLIHLHVH